MHDRGTLGSVRSQLTLVLKLEALGGCGNIPLLGWSVARSQGGHAVASKS